MRSQLMQLKKGLETRIDLATLVVFLSKIYVEFLRRSFERMGETPSHAVQPASEIGKANRQAAYSTTSIRTRITMPAKQSFYTRAGF